MELLFHKIIALVTSYHKDANVSVTKPKAEAPMESLTGKLRETPKFRH